MEKRPRNSKGQFIKVDKNNDNISNNVIGYKLEYSYSKTGNDEPEVHTKYNIITSDGKHIEKDVDSNSIKKYISRINSIFNNDFYNIPTDKFLNIFNH